MKRLLLGLLLAAFVAASGCRSVQNGSLAASEAVSTCVRIAPERIGVCSWSWRLPLDEVAVQMEKSGVKGVHLALGPFISPDGRHGAAEDVETLARIKDKIARGEWTLMSTMVGMVGEDYSTLDSIRRTGGIVPDRNWEANRRIVTRGARLTQELGCKYMSTHAGFLDASNPKAFATFLSRIVWMRDECRKYGVTLILESGQETAEDLAAFMPRVPGVYVNFDPANMILYGKGRPLDAVKVLAPWIRQIHVKDAKATKVPGTWGEETPWGEGEVGGKAFLAELEKIGFKGNYVVEREGGKCRADDIRLAIERLEK